MSNGNNTSGVPVESAMPDAATPAEDQPNLQTAIGAMVEYPEGRGGMGIVSMPGSGLTDMTPVPLSPIGPQPEPINMAAAALQDR